MRFLLLLLIPAISFAQNGLVTIKLKGGSSGVSGWGLNGNSIVDSNFIGTTNSKDLVFKTKNTEAMRIDTNGNVGIGTAAPTYKLQVYESRLLRDVFFAGRPDDGDSADYITYSSSDGFLCKSYDAIGNYVLLSTGNYLEPTINWQGTNATLQTSGLLTFSLDTSEINNEGLKITGQVGATIHTLIRASILTGYVGIGASTPTAKLHVNGTTRLEGTPQSTTSDSLLTIDGQGNVAWRTPYYYGTDTLTNGVDTVWTSNVTANSNIQLTSNGLNGSTQSGNLDVTIISAGNYFVVNSLKTNTTIETGDQRKYYWFFIRKP